jgi:hypothetical protein
MGDQDSVTSPPKDSDAWSQSTKRNSTPILTLQSKDISKDGVSISLKGMSYIQLLFYVLI